MTVSIHSFPRPEEVIFFNGESGEYLLYNIRCIGELQTMDSEFTDTGYCHVFKVFFSYGIDIDFSYETLQDAAAARQVVIKQLINLWGNDQVVFSNGFNYDVTLIDAIRNVTDIMRKDNHSGFAITVSDVPYPIHLVFNDVDEAHLTHRLLILRVEQQRREAAKSSKLKMAVNG